MNHSVVIGASIPAGMDYLKLFTKLKLGNCVLTFLPMDKAEALAVANYCREHKIVLYFSELLYRGSTDLCWAARAKMPRNEFYSKSDLEQIVSAAGPYYGGRYAIGEAGGVLYWPKAYIIRRRVGEYVNLPPAKTVAQARDAYVDYLARLIRYERNELGGEPLINVDSSIVFKYHAQAGIDILCLEVMPGDTHRMHAAIRGAGRAYGKPWGVHIAALNYGGVSFDELWHKRWKMALYYSYIAGANFIYPESGHTGRDPSKGKHFPFHSREITRVRQTLREIYQFSGIHTRPSKGPKTTLGVVHGHLDGSPGLWNKYVWGQYRGRKWLAGPAEKGWDLLDAFHRKQDLSNPYVQGEMDFSGNPPFGQYDAIPIEAPLKRLKSYRCLLFLAWNTMTADIYAKLKDYVKGGGHLIMFLPHLSTHIDRANDLKLFNRGDFRDLFGVKVLGKGRTDVMGIKCFDHSSLRAYRFPFWRINTDPRFMGQITPARLELTRAKGLCGYDDYYYVTPEKLAAQAILTENTLGKGKAFLVAAWQYPADDGLRPFTEDILRTVLAGEQGEIRLLASDRVRYAVYEGKLPGRTSKYHVAYLLNTDPDYSASARLWIRGRFTGPFDVPPADLRIAYCRWPIVLVPEDKRVELKNWTIDQNRHTIELYNVRNQKLNAYNLGNSGTVLCVNGKTQSFRAADHQTLTLPKRVDPARRELFSPDFLVEPAVRYKEAPLPY